MICTKNILFQFLSHSFLIAIISLTSCDDKKETSVITVNTGNLEIKVDSKLHTFLESKASNAKAIVSGFQPSEYLLLAEGKLADFELLEATEKKISLLNGGITYSFIGVDKKNGIKKILELTAYDSFPDFVTTKVRYINASEKDIEISGWVNNHYGVQSQQDDPPFWAFQGSSSGARADWIKPVSEGFYQENYMGMNNSDYGGGIPVTDVWRKDLGIAIGHTTPSPKLISLPTKMNKYGSEVSLAVRKQFETSTYLEAGDTLETLETFLTLHRGDYYNGLQNYSKFMQAKGLKMPEAEPEAFEPIWCAWGYERDFTIQEVIGTLPKVKDLGIKWAVIDDGFQKAEGDWHLNEKKFPQGDQQMKALVKTIHDYGLKAKIWWAPLAADPGSKLLSENPDMRLFTQDGSPQYITWWDAYYLSPSHPKTVQHTKDVVNLFLNEWDFDGLKMDGQHMNAIAPDYNEGAQIKIPEESTEKFPEFFEMIYREARNIKPNAVVENCPCGTCMSFFNMPYMNQSVSSDPLSSWQVRLKGKTYKALIPNTAYYGDHVELSDNGSDFASSFGVGAVLGTKFTWPKDNPSAPGSYLLTREKEKIWKQWFSLYNEKMLSKQPYLGNLYDLGYDKPETHIIKKGDTLHYALYADKWSGDVELKGLSDEKTYEVRDYINNQILGTVTSSNNLFKAEFTDNLLIEVYPK